MEELTFKQLMLSRLRVRAQAAVPNQLLAESKLAFVPENLTDQLVASMESYVLQHRQASDEWTVEENPVFESWRDHLMFGLPRGSIRRRFLGYYFGHDVRAKKVTHTVTVNTSSIFPNATVRFPDDLGRPVAFSTLEATRMTTQPD